MTSGSTSKKIEIFVFFYNNFLNTWYQNVIGFVSIELSVIIPLFSLKWVSTLVDQRLVLIDLGIW